MSKLKSTFFWKFPIGRSGAQIKFYDVIWKTTWLKLDNLPEKINLTSNRVQKPYNEEALDTPNEKA